MTARWLRCWAACCQRSGPLTVITNNAAIIDALKGEAGITLIAFGGIYSAKFNGFFGVVTEEALARLRADIAFISTPAVQGLTPSTWMMT